MKNAAALAFALLTGACGYALRWWVTPQPKPPSYSVENTPPETPDRAALRTPADYHAIKNQLAICMAYHPPDDEKDRQIARCQWDLAAARTPHRTLSDCYDYIDLTPTYDRELPAGWIRPLMTLERVKNMTAADCVRVMSFSTMANRQMVSCLQGDSPPGFKERYAPPGARPFVKACSEGALRAEAMNAWLRREEDRVREMGHEVKNRIRMDADGGVRVWPGPGSSPE